MTSSLSAVVATAGAPFVVDRVRLPRLVGNQVLVRVEAVGICHADLGARAGDFPVPYPVVLGHEGCGVVVGVGPAVTAIRPGQRVVLTFDSCGSCSQCRADRPSRCVHLLTRNWTGDTASPRAAGASADVHVGFFGQSAFAEYAIAGERNAIPVDTTLSAELLAPLGCGVQTGFGAVRNVLRPVPGDVVAVFGAGAVGLSAVMACSDVGGITVVVVDPDPARRALAQELGASVAVDADAGDPADAIRQRFPGGVQGAVECSGRTSAFAAAVLSCGTGGTTVVVGAPPFGTLAGLDVADVVNSSKRIVGSVEGDSVPGESIPHLVGLIERGRLPVDRLVTTYPLAEIERAAQDMATGRVVKPVLTFT